LFFLLPINETDLGAAPRVGSKFNLWVWSKISQGLKFNLQRSKKKHWGRYRCVSTELSFALLVEESDELSNCRLINHKKQPAPAAGSKLILSPTGKYSEQWWLSPQACRKPRNHF